MSTTILNDAIIDALTKRILEKLQEQSIAQASAIINELIDNRKTTSTLATRISLLESKIEKQSQQLEKLSQEKQNIQEIATKALTILNEAKRELGIE